MDVRILGPLEVTHNARVLEPGGFRQRVLLARLAVVANRVVSIDALLDELWGSQPPGAAKQALQAQVSRLRRALGDPNRVVARGPGYLLQLGSDELDATRFEILLTRAGHAAAGADLEAATENWAEADKAWRGPPLVEFQDYGFARAEAARLEELRLGAIDARIEVELELGRHGKLVAELERLVGEYPYRERLWRHLMLALYRSGRQAEALGVFQRLRGVLGEELGIEPSPELAHMEQAILLHSRELDWEPRASVAAPQGSPLVPTRPGSAAYFDQPVSAPDRPLVEGSVTFCVADLEDATAALVRQEDSFTVLLAEQWRALAAIAARYDGVRLPSRGDEVVFSFLSPSVALAASLEMLRQQLTSAAGPLELRARVAVDSGWASPHEGGYLSLALQRALRLLCAGHGGQLLVGDATASERALVLPEGASLLDLGTFRLQGFDAPQRVWQLVHPSLPRHGPVLKALPAAHHNLPVARTSFLGRDRDVTALAKLCFAHSLVTVTGAGGVGKTRLALAVGETLAGHHVDGTRFVDLAAVRDAALVPLTVAEAVGLRVSPRRSVIEQLAVHLDTHDVLLVVDNCEHVLEAVASLFADLLGACSLLGVLATSREPLQIPGEQVLRLRPLSVPPSGASPRTVADTPAVQLFLERAAATGRQVQQEELQAVAQLCRLLDGLPLAIELLAGQSFSMNADVLLNQIQDRLLLPARGRPMRHRTLSAAIEWSHDLLDGTQRRVFRRLATFAGGAPLDGIETVCAGEDLVREQVSAALSGLVDRSLVEARGDNGARWRYSTLETVRRYAHERLVASGEEAVAAARHLAWCRQIVVVAMDERRTAKPKWWSTIEAEQDNLRSALNHGVSEGELSVAVEVAVSLTHYWFHRGRLHEGQIHLERCLARRTDLRPELAGRLLRALGHLVWNRGDYTGSQHLFREALGIARATGDEVAVAESLSQLGAAYMAEDAVKAQQHLEAAVEAWRHSGADQGEFAALTQPLNNLAVMCRERGDYADARALLLECLALAEQAGDEVRVADHLCVLGTVALYEGGTEEAERLFDRSVSISERLGYRARHVQANWGLGEVARRRGDDRAAARHFAEGLHMVNHRDHPMEVERLLVGLATVAAMRGGDEVAGRLFSASERVRGGRMNVMTMPTQRNDRETWIARVRDRLGPRWDTVWREESEQSIEDVIALALSLAQE